MLTSVLALFLPALSACAGRDGAVKTNAYDGHWWLSAGIREQLGFLNGFRDCYLYEYKGRVRYSVGTPYEWQRQITAFYEGTPTGRNMPAAEFILRAHVDTDGKLPLEGRDKEDHGAYDGVYWSQAYGLGGPAEQRGFVAGYLWCHAELCKNRGGTFSLAPAEYATRITRWYAPETGDGNAGRERAKIADVLFKFRDAKWGAHAAFDVGAETLVPKPTKVDSQHTLR